MLSENDPAVQEMVRGVVASIALETVCTVAFADVTLLHIFGDHMVLQQDIC